MGVVARGESTATQDSSCEEFCVAVVLERWLDGLLLENTMIISWKDNWVPVSTRILKLDAKIFAHFMLEILDKFGIFSAVPTICSAPDVARV